MPTTESEDRKKKAKALADMLPGLEERRKKLKLKPIVKERHKPAKKKRPASAASEQQDKLEKEHKAKLGSMGDAAFSPAEQAAKRKRERDEKGPSLSKTLTTLAASTRPGTSKIGKAISGALSGAAIGATIGEARDAKRKRAKTKAREAKREAEERKKKKKNDGGSE